MVYNSIANLQLVCVGGSSAELTFFQTLADSKITAYIASPNATGAITVEADLVYRYWHNAHMHEPSLVITNQIYLATELTREMKAQLDGPMETAEIDNVDRSEDWDVQ